MKKPHAPALRSYLRDHPEGATIAQMQKDVESLAKVNDHTLRNALGSMPDVYIDRWADPKRGQYQAVWCVIVPPPDCPYPTNRFRPETTWIKKNAAYRNNQSFCLGRTPAPVQDQL